jgi:predicted amidohydrolase
MARGTDHHDPAPLTITLLQAAPKPHDPESNRRLFRDLLKSLEKPGDLIILPEMFNTGFTMAAAALAEPPDGPTTAWMQRTARETGAAVTGSFIINEDGRYFNRLLWAEPAGKLLWYDKRHLFRQAGENRVFTAGRQRVVWQWRGWRILPQVCYDLRFPVWSRNRNDYDLVFYVASWPTARMEAWNTLLKARALENLSYCVGVNRTGTDKRGVPHPGESQIIDPRGEILLSAGNRNGAFSVTLDYHLLREWRAHFPAHEDADPFTLEI